MIKIRTEAKGNTIPVVSSDSISKIIKKSLFAYFVSIKPLSSPSLHNDVNVNHTAMSINVNVNNSRDDDVTMQDVNHEEFLKQYHDCFSDSLPDELPPMRGQDDHRIDLIPGTAPMNKPLYCVSRAQ